MFLLGLPELWMSVCWADNRASVLSCSHLSCVHMYPSAWLWHEQGCLGQLEMNVGKGGFPHVSLVPTGCVHRWAARPGSGHGCTYMQPVQGLLTQLCPVPGSPLARGASTSCCSSFPCILLCDMATQFFSELNGAEASEGVDKLPSVGSSVVSILRLAVSGSGNELCCCLSGCRCSLGTLFLYLCTSWVVWPP